VAASSQRSAPWSISPDALTPILRPVSTGPPREDTDTAHERRLGVWYVLGVVGISFARHQHVPRPCPRPHPVFGHDDCKTATSSFSISRSESSRPSSSDDVFARAPSGARSEDRFSSPLRSPRPHSVGVSLVLLAWRFSAPTLACGHFNGRTTSHLPSIVGYLVASVILTIAVGALSRR